MPRWTGHISDDLHPTRMRRHPDGHILIRSSWFCTVERGKCTVWPEHRRCNHVYCKGHFAWIVTWCYSISTSVPICAKARCRYQTTQSEGSDEWRLDESVQHQNASDAEHKADAMSSKCPGDGPFVTKSELLVFSDVPVQLAVEDSFVCE